MLFLLSIVILPKRLEEKKFAMCDSVELIKGFVRNKIGWLVVFFTDKKTRALLRMTVKR